MTHFDKNKVREVARLARLTFKEDDAATYAQELERIFAWIDQLNEVDTSQEEPLLNISGVAIPHREDKALLHSQEREKILANAPMRLQDFFAVPKVIDREES